MAPGAPAGLLAYDPAETSGQAFGPAPGEYPGGAAAGRVDVSEGTVAAVLFGYAFGLPDLIRVAVWQEPACGLPGAPAEALPWQDVAAADVTEDPSGLLRLPLGTPITLDPAAGYTWVGTALTGSDVTTGTLPTYAGEHEPRFAWYGLADADCDGVNDDALGWEDIRTPSASGVAAADADLAAGVELSD